MNDTTEKTDQQQPKKTYQAPTLTSKGNLVQETRTGINGPPDALGCS